MEAINILGILLLLEPSLDTGQTILVDDEGFYPSKITLQRGEPVRLNFVFDGDEIRKGLRIPLFGLDYAYQQDVRPVEFIPNKDFGIVSQRYDGALMGVLEVEVIDGP